MISHKKIKTQLDRTQKSEIRNQKSEIRNQKSEIRNQKSEIRNQGRVLAMFASISSAQACIICRRSSRYSAWL
ncbi:hypothetical protein EGK62_03305 [Pseudomonas aeruginosa]|nr:hypothetical protein EGJ96_03305 [Pseudomonas aeruginosa]RRY14727.1 hypothetical protein EGK62_03305 [Pseudomonas aeruginosa]HBP5167055.1 hypothetical protein [Pseudomonas aeruginosa]